MSDKIVPPISYTSSSLSPYSNEEAPVTVASPMPAASVHPTMQPPAPHARARRKALLDGMQNIRDASSAQQNKSQDLSLIDTAVTGDPVRRELARAILSATDGLHSDTLRRECELFKGFERPGFPDPEVNAAKAMSFLKESFGVDDITALVAAVSTAAAHLCFPLHEVAERAIEHGVLDWDSPVGLSTIRQERQFKLSIGF